MRKQVFVLVPGNERGGGASHLIAFAFATTQVTEDWRFTFIVAGSGFLRDRLEKLGVHTLVVEGGLRSTVSGIAAYLQTEASTSVKNEWVVLHAHGPRMNLFAYLISRKTGIRWTSTLHSDPAKDFLANWWKGLLFSRLNLFCLRQTKELFAVSRELAEKIPGKPVYLVKNAAFFQPLTGPKRDYEQSLRRILGVPEHVHLIGMAARLNPVKDIPTTLKAVGLLVEKLRGQDDVHLAIAGEGPARLELERLAEQIGLSGQIHFLGFVSQIGEFLAGLDIHVLSSISEGTGLSILEAGYYGVVNVGTDIEGVCQMISDGETGLLFPVGDAPGLAEALKRLLSDKTMRENLVQSFRENVLPQFSPERMLDSYLAGYEAMMTK